MTIHLTAGGTLLTVQSWPAVPSVGEHVTHAGTTYVVVGRSWSTASDGTCTLALVEVP